MSRFSDDSEPRDDGKDTSGLYRANLERALRGRRGRQALRDLRDALMALPEKRLIEGALCSVGIQDRIAALPTKVTIEGEPLERDADGMLIRDEHGRVIRGPRQPMEVDNWQRKSLVEWVEEHEGQPEGVCFVGAYAWWQKVKAGMDREQAFAELDVIPDTDAGEWETAEAGKEAGLAGVLAWHLAYMNDEELGGLTPAARWSRCVAWIDRQLADPVGV